MCYARKRAREWEGRGRERGKGLLVWLAEELNCVGRDKKGGAKGVELSVHPKYIPDLRSHGYVNLPLTFRLPSIIRKTSQKKN